MSHFEFIKQITINETFRNKSVIDRYDLIDKNLTEKFIGDINFTDDWKIGVIVGNSGTGKTTIAKNLFENEYINNYEYDENSVIDNMPKEKTLKEIEICFNSVGFSSPPSWLKPYNVLSNGEKMRVDLARAILNDRKLIVFDEFTSVVDRTIAQISSFAIQKSIRRTNKKFIAVTCHYDVIDWLLPDWIFDTNTMTFYEGQKKNRPDIRIEIYETQRSEWKMFKKYHYLSEELSTSSRCYIMYANNLPCGFIAILHFPHPKAKNIKSVHRLVILPEFQGIGLSKILLNSISNLYTKNEYRMIITTSNPALMTMFKNSKEWNITRYGRTSGGTKTSIIKKSLSSKRITISAEYNG